MHVGFGKLASMDGGFFGGPTVSIISRINTLEAFIGQGVRRFGQEGMQDAKQIAELRADLAALKETAQEINRLGQDQRFAAAADLGLTKLFEPLRSMQRDAYTIVQQIEEEMRTRAKFNAAAFLASKQNILAACLAAVGTALLLGFSISSSLLWPISRIRSTLSQIAAGSFDQRVEVANRDELGALAGHVNDTSNRLGALYDEVEMQKAKLSEWNASLEGKVADKLVEIERNSRLRRFLPSQIADLILESDDENEVLGTRRAEVTVLFADLRGFTSFANSALQAQVIVALNAFHGACGPRLCKNTNF